MLMTKLKIAVAVLLAVGVAGTGVMAVAQAGGVLRASSNGFRSRSDGPVGGGAPEGKTRGPSLTFAEKLALISRKMGVIKDRLRMASGGKQTQKSQREVVVRLDELIEELENRKQKTPKTSGLLAELKIVRAMQKRINARTEIYGSQYQGEQVPRPETTKDPKEREQRETIRRELKELAVRQEKVAAVTHELATRKD